MASFFSLMKRSLPYRAKHVFYGFARNSLWKYTVFITFSLKENMKTCFDHNSPKSSPIRSSFCTHPRRDTVSLSLLQNYSNPTRNCIFWKSKKKKTRRARSLLSYTISTLYTYVGELKSNLHENLVWTRNLHRSSPKLVHFIYRL